MRRYRFGCGRRKNNFNRKLLFGVLILTVCVLIGIAENRLPYIQSEMFPAAAGRYVKEKLAATVPEYLEDITEEQSDGHIVLDTYRLNQIKGDLIQKIQNEISGKTVIWIPIGSLTDSALLNGRGIKIPLKLAVEGTADIEFISELRSAGINRTQYSVTIIITVEAFSVSSGMCESITVQSQYLLHESVFEGEVPLSLH